MQSFFNEVGWHFVCIFSPLFSFLLKLETQDATGLEEGHYRTNRLCINSQERITYMLYVHLHSSFMFHQRKACCTFVLLQSARN